MSEDLDTRDVDPHAAAPTRSADAGVVTARRRMMLGAAAAVLPSVVSLPAGAQRAAGSFTCVLRGGPPPPTWNWRFTDVPDEWLRKKVFSGQAVKAGRTAYCITWDQPSILAIATFEKTANGSGYKALVGTTWSTGGDSSESNIKIGAACGAWDPSQGAGMGSYCYSESIENISSAPDTYALVYVSEDGLSSSLEPGDGMYPVRASCYASLLGDRGSFLG